MEEEGEFKLKHGTAIALLRELQPPPGASEGWVRAKAVEIDQIAREQCLARPELAQALFYVGVAQARDRSRALQAQNVGRAVLAGVRASNAHKTAVDAAKVESLVVKTLGRMFPTAMSVIDRLVGGVDLSAVAPIPVQAPAQASVPAQAPLPAAIPAPAPTAPAETRVPPKSLVEAAKFMNPAKFDRSELLFPRKDKDQ